MDGIVLVAYASKHGSTREVADAICESLHRAGLRAHLRPAADVDDLEGYGAVVLGAPIYMGRWHRHAHRFLRRHEKNLTDRPLAVFALGPVSEEASDWRQSREHLDAALARHEVDPVRVEMFGGKVDPAQLLFPFSHLKGGDYRDWNAVAAWAAGLPAALGIRSPLLV